MSKKQKKQSQVSSGVGIAANSTGPTYFYEDEIYRVTKSGEVEFGMVTENWEMYSSESEESDEDQETDKVPKGHVAVTWHPSGKEGVISEAKVHLSDRSLMPGDVVRRLISGKDTQRGYARAVKVRAVVQTIGSKEVFPNVNVSSLTPVQKFQPDVAVYLDAWIGSVRDMRYKLTLRFSDKSVCVVDSYTIAEYFEDLRPSAGGFRNGDIFYPGQRLHGPVRYLRNAEWSFCSDDMKRAKDRKQVTGVVTHVECIGVSVQWQYQTPISPLEQELQQKLKGNSELKDKDSNPELAEGEEEKIPERDWERKKPTDFVTGEDMKRLKSLNLFDSCTVQLGDISFYTASPNETPIDKKTWKKEKNVYLWASTLNEKLATTKLNDDELSTENENEDTQDSSIKNERDSDNQLNNKNESSGTLVSGSSNPRKNLPKVSTRSLRKKKLKKARQAAVFTDAVTKETQLVVEAIHTSSTVDVVWQDGNIEEGMRSIDLYPIHHLDDHEFFPGDFIIRSENSDQNVYGVVQNMDHNGRVANVKWFETYTNDGNCPKELKVEEVSVYDIKDHPDFRFRPGTVVFRIANLQPNQFSGGQVLDNYPDGQIRVWWANNVEQQCWPQDLFRIGDYDSDEGELWDDQADIETVLSDDSWETDLDDEDQEENGEIANRKKSPLRRKSTDILIQTPGIDANTKGESVDVQVPIATESLSASEVVVTSTSIMDLAGIVCTAEPVPHFSVLGVVADSHRFFGTSFQPSNSRSFLKTVQKEITLLRNNLPPGIFVKGFENRMDLYSVMIHGPKNTPYEDGLFFFDIQLPSTYPDAPPIVHYVSFCQSRLNPNLYECGKVCISLLGTWTGKGNETWTSDSSVLQLLISIQGLILVPEPYYNEAGYERQRGSQQGEENSRMYNEMVLIKLVQSMSRMLLNPHSPFEVEIVQHIRARGPWMSERYKKWLTDSEKSSMHACSSAIDAKKGSEAESMCNMDPGFPLFPVSKGFSITLKKTLDTFGKLFLRSTSATNTPSTAPADDH